MGKWKGIGKVKGDMKKPKVVGKRGGVKARDVIE